MKQLLLILAIGFMYSTASAQSLYIKGSKKGEIESDGDIYINGSRKGQIESDGDVYVNGSRVGQIENDGDIYKNGSRVGQMSLTAMCTRMVAGSDRLKRMAIFTTMAPGSANAVVFVRTGLPLWYSFSSSKI